MIIDPNHTSFASINLSLTLFSSPFSKYMIVPEGTQNPFSQAPVPAFGEDTCGSDAVVDKPQMSLKRRDKPQMSLKRRIEEKVMPNWLRVRAIEECREEVVWGYRDARLKHDMLVQAGWTPLSPKNVRQSVVVP